MRKSNYVFAFVFISLLLSLPFLISCAESEREIMFPETDIPESVTVIVKDVSEGTEFDLTISTDYSEYKDNLGGTVFVYDYSEKYTVNNDFKRTFQLETEEPTIALDLTCTYDSPINEESPSSVRLILQFNGKGNFSLGNHNQDYPVEVGTKISLRRAFSQYEGISTSLEYSAH